MSVNWEGMITGQAPTALSEIVTRINQIYAAGTYTVKIGITNDPERRWREEYAKLGWRSMNVLFRTSGYPRVQFMERTMINWIDPKRGAPAKYKLEVAADGFFTNDKTGGAGRKPREGPYFLYVVEAPKWARLRVWDRS